MVCVLRGYDRMYTLLDVILLSRRLILLMKEKTTGIRNLDFESMHIPPMSEIDCSRRSRPAGERPSESLHQTTSRGGPRM